MMAAIGFALVAACCAPASAQNNLITIDVHDALLSDVIALLAAESGANIVSDSSVKPDRVTLHLQNVTFDDALTVLVRSNDLQVRRQNGVMIVGTSESMNRRYGDQNDPRY
jgi:general secretion pathway protein D